MTRLDAGGDGDADADGDGDGDLDADADADLDADGDGDGDGDDPFARGRIVEVSIDLPNADWEAIVGAHRSLGDLLAGDCLASPHGDLGEAHDATVTIDSRPAVRAWVRRTGLVAEAGDARPSLAIELDEPVQGMTTVTLEAVPLDPSGMRACVGLDRFAAAGLPAPRCNFAHVVAAGRDVGMYVHVETVDDAFLERVTGGAPGALFRGAVSDFREGWTGTFDPQNDAASDRSALAAVTAALEARDGDLEEALEEVLDVEAYLTFWAVEVMTGHFDGYAGNMNNFFVAQDPSTGRLTFVPWGLDHAMWNLVPLTSFAATARLPRRILGDTALRARALTRLDEVAAAWDDDAIVESIDDMDALLSPLAPRGYSRAVDEVRGFVRSRRAVVEEEIATFSADGILARPYPCTTTVGHVEGSIETSWGTMADQDPLSTGSGDFAGSVGDVAFGVVAVGAAAGPDPNDGTRAVLDAVAVLADGTVAVAWFALAPDLVTDGAEIPLDLGGADAGSLLRYDPADGSFTTLGVLTGGTLVIEEGEVRDGATIRASFEGDVIDSAWF